MAIPEGVIGETAVPHGGTWDHFCPTVPCPSANGQIAKSPPTLLAIPFFVPLGVCLLDQPLDEVDQTAVGLCRQELGLALNRRPNPKHQIRGFRLLNPFGHSRLRSAMPCCLLAFNRAEPSIEAILQHKEAIVAPHYPRVSDTISPFRSQPEAIALPDPLTPCGSARLRAR